MSWDHNDPETPKWGLSKGNGSPYVEFTFKCNSFSRHGEMLSSVREETNLANEAFVNSRLFKVSIVNQINKRLDNIRSSADIQVTVHKSALDKTDYSSDLPAVKLKQEQNNNLPTVDTEELSDPSLEFIESNAFPGDNQQASYNFKFVGCKPSDDEEGSDLNLRRGHRHRIRPVRYWCDRSIYHKGQLKGIFKRRFTRDC